MRFLWLILILAGAVYSTLTVKLIYAQAAPLSPTCAPGDVLVDTNDDQIPDSCLYGSEVVPDYLGAPITDPKDNIRRVINITLGFLGIVVVIMIIYGGFLWLTAAGNEEKITKGKHTLMWAAIGAIVISIAWTIASYVLQVGKTIG